MGDNRGVSDLVGFVLTVGIILTGVGIVATVGVDQVERIQGTQDVENAERAVTVLAGNVEQLQESRATVLTSELAVHNGRLAIGAGAGPSNLTIDVSGTDVTLGERPMRTISYRTGDTRIVYEGGTVIRDNANGESIAVREPPFTCSSNRAVISFVEIHEEDTGQGYSGATASITTRTNESRILFPRNRSGEDSLGESTGVTLTVNSDHEAAWSETLRGAGWELTGTPGEYECTGESTNTPVFVRKTIVDISINR